MKGLQHDVIEIRDTHSEEIDRILVFLKPGEHKIDIGSTRRQAEDILQKVKVKKKPPKFITKKTIVLMLACGFVALVIFALMYAGMI